MAEGVHWVGIESKDESILLFIECILGTQVTVVSVSELVDMAKSTCSQ